MRFAMLVMPGRRGTDAAGITGLFVNTAPIRGRWDRGWCRPSGATVNILAQRG